MKICVWDKGAYRKWKAILPERTLVEWRAPDYEDPGLIESESQRRLDVPALVICHPVPELTELNRVLAAHRIAPIFLLTISGASRYGITQPADARLHHREAAVGEEDAWFGQCVRKFVGDLQTRIPVGEPPDWSILEGPPAPDALLAYHLLGVLLEHHPNDDKARALRERLKAEAIAEGRAIAASVGAGVEFDEKLVDDASQLKRFLIDCAQ